MGRLSAHPPQDTSTLPRHDGMLVKRLSVGFDSSSFRRLGRADKCVFCGLDGRELACLGKKGKPASQQAFFGIFRPVWKQSFSCLHASTYFGPEARSASLLLARPDHAVHRGRGAKPPHSLHQLDLRRRANTSAFPTAKCLIQLSHVVEGSELLMRGMFVSLEGHEDPSSVKNFIFMPERKEWGRCEVSASEAPDGPHQHSSAGLSASWRRSPKAKGEGRSLGAHTWHAANHSSTLAN